MRTLNLHEIHTLPRREKRGRRLNWGLISGLAFAVGCWTVAGVIIFRAMAG